MMYSSMWSELCQVSFRQDWIDAAGVRTRFLASGEQAENHPLILLHGTGGHAEAYIRNLGPHGRFFRTYAIDMLGHGWTDRPNVQMEIPAYVDHLIRVIDAFGFDKVHLSGESLGGWVAARFALTHPDRLNRLVLNTTGGSAANPEVMARIKEITQRAADSPTWEFVQYRLEWLMHDKQQVTDDLVATRQAIYGAPGAAEAIRRALILQEMEVRQRNLLQDDDWSHIKAKALVLWTTHDPTNPPSEGERIARLIPGAQFALMQHCGHWPQYEDANKFNEIQINFLQGKSPAQASRGATA